jgi:predicted acyl esterase
VRRDRAASAEPGQVKTNEIDLWSTSNVVLAGHRIRVHVTSSSCPRWDRSLNTGEQGGGQKQAAEQQVHHGADAPTYIELPVVEVDTDAP